MSVTGQSKNAVMGSIPEERERGVDGWTDRQTKTDIYMFYITHTIYMYDVC